MPVPPFLEQIPEYFRKDPIMYRFVENLYTRFNQQIAESNKIERNLAILEQTATDGTGGGSGVVFPNPEEFTEVRVESAPVNVVTETYYYASGNFTATFSMVLPEFPEENFYIRAQVFDNKTFFFFAAADQTGTAKKINGNTSVSLSGNGNTVDIRYSIDRDEYVLT